MTESATPAPASHPPATHESSNPALVVSSSELFRGSQEIHIQHKDEIYRLRITRNGKLILTK